MAKGNGKAGKPAKKSLSAIFSAAGYEMETQKTKLWDIDNAVEIIPDIQEYDFKLYMGTEHESFFVTLIEGNQSIVVPFITGEIASKDIDLKDEDLNDKETAYAFSDVQGFLAQMESATIRVIEVEALRDDEEFGIAQGDKVLRATLV